MSGLETVALSKRQEAELEVAEMKMLRFSLGVTRLDKIRNEQIRGTVKVEQFGDKAREAREVDPQPPPTRVWTLVSDRLPLPSPSLHSSQSRHFTRSHPQLTGPTKPTCPVTECTTALHLWHPGTAASHASPRELLVGDEGFHQYEE
ncbi:hypothetical protein SRHO_G00222940 [Serrasalmus rhombeus]